jgi:WhiB family redox-sensing transcriptional regulator
MTTFVELSDAIEEVGIVPCHSAPDIYFVDEEVPGFLVLTKYAKSLCEECPVRNLCADYAITNVENFGVWGGTSPADRKAIRRRISNPGYVRERV